MRTEVYVDGPEDTVAIMYPADLAPEFTLKQAGSCGTYDPLNCMNAVGVTFKKKPAGLLMPYGYPVEYFTENITKEEIESMAYGAGNWRAGAGGYWRDGAAVHTGGLIGEPTFQGTIIKDKWTRINERERTYHFADDVTTSVDCTAWLWVSSSGTHCIKDSYGKIHIINKAWVRITITE